MTVENDRYKKRIIVGKLTEAYVSIPKKLSVSTVR